MLPERRTLGLRIRLDSFAGPGRQIGSAGSEVLLALNAPAENKKYIEFMKPSAAGRRGFLSRLKLPGVRRVALWGYW